MALDKNYNYITPEGFEASIADEIGTSGLYQFGGFIDEEFLPVLRFPNSTRIYREMVENDSVIASILFAIEMLIRGVKWKIESRSQHPEDLKLANYVDECFNDMDKPFNDVISEIISFLTYGFSVQELVYKRRFGQNQPDPRFRSRFTDGLWGWRKISIRSQDTILRWEFGPHNRLEGVWQYPPNMGGAVYIPKHRFLLFRVNSKKDNPESTSILRSAYRSWYFKKRIEELEAIGIERDLAGLPMARIPAEYMAPGATPAQKALYDQVKKIVSDVRQNSKAGIVFPSTRDEKGNLIMDFELMTSPGQKQIDTNLVINRYNMGITQAVLADFIMLGQQGKGSYALSEDKTELFGAALEAWIDNIQDVFNRYAIPRLFEVNGISTEYLPRLSHSLIDIKDISKLSAYFQQLISVGAITPDDELEDYLRKAARAPLKNRDDL